MADYSGIIDEAAQRFDVDPKLISAVIQTESGGNPNAVSSAGAIGLGQIMPATAKSLGIDPTDPIQNIYGTAQILSQNLTKFGNVPDALRAFNGGWDPSKWSNSETQAYVPKVAQAYAELSQQDQGGQQTAQNGASDVPLTSAASAQAVQPNDAFSKMFGAVMPKDAPAAASSKSAGRLYAGLRTGSRGRAVVASRQVWLGVLRRQFARPDHSHGTARRWICPRHQ